MKQSFCLVFLAFAWTAGILGGLPVYAQQPTTRPNVLLITTDHMRMDNVAANGYPWMQTPNLDRLAREGVSLKRAFIVGIACQPSRASLMTGRYPSHHGVRTNGIALPEDEVTITHLLREAGYYAGQFGKLHFWPHSPMGFMRSRSPMNPAATTMPMVVGCGLRGNGHVRRVALPCQPTERVSTTTLFPATKAGHTPAGRRIK